MRALRTLLLLSVLLLLIASPLFATQKLYIKSDAGVCHVYKANTGGTFKNWPIMKDGATVTWYADGANKYYIEFYPPKPPSDAYPGTPFVNGNNRIYEYLVNSNGKQSDPALRTPQQAAGGAYPFPYDIQVETPDGKKSCLPGNSPMFLLGFIIKP